MASKSTKARDIKNLKAGIAYNDAHVEDHSKKLKEHQAHLAKMKSKQSVVKRIPLVPVGKEK